MFNTKMAFVVKKIIVGLCVMIVAMAFSSCRNIAVSPEQSVSKTDMQRKITFDESVTDKERANEIIEIADKYFVNELKADLEEFGSLIVSFNNETKEWTVFYLPGRPEEAIFDGDFWLVISNEKSEVVDVGFGG